MILLTVTITKKNNIDKKKKFLTIFWDFVTNETIYCDKVFIDDIVYFCDGILPGLGLTVESQSFFTFFIFCAVVCSVETEINFPVKCG